MVQFPSTHWSLIRRSGETPSARRDAFGELARNYRGAILAFFRARLGGDAAEDATQTFLAASFEHAWWSRADADRGSFRGFLLLLLRRHLGHLLEFDRVGGVSLDSVPELADPGALAERQFDSRFALVLTARALDVLRGDYASRGRAAMFDQLLPLLSAPPEHGQTKFLAVALGLPANTLTVEIKRLRQRLRECLRAELLQLCADEAAFETEWAALQQILDGA